MNLSAVPFLFLLLTVCSSYAQNPARSGKDFAYFFYITTFDDRGWDRLPETQTEVEALSTELESNYGFETEIFGNLNKQDILKKIQELNQRNHGANDQVLFFFTTHGNYQTATERGFLIPKDGRAHDPYGSSWISYDDLGSYITLNKCDHVMLALDACYSGSFGERWKGPPDKKPWEGDADCATKEKYALEWDSRLYFSSGSKAQRTPAQSRFASRWLEALRRGAEEGVVRTKDLGYYLSAIEYPAPEGGTFSSKHEEGGDFAFVHKNACGKAPPPIDKTADKNAWLAASQADNLPAYQKYRSDFPNGEFRPLAERRIAELEAVHQEELAWETAKRTNTIMAYEGFMREYPRSAYQAMAEYNRSQLEAKKETYQPAQPATTNTDLPDFVFVQGGTFQMGSDDGDSDEKPVHSVTLSDFYLHKNELTNSEFVDFLNSVKPSVSGKDVKLNGNLIYDLVCTGCENWDDRISYSGGRFFVKSNYENHPVVLVTWYGAVAYCNWLSDQGRLQKVYTISGSSVTANWNANGYRLPTEAEWEFAAQSRNKDDKWAGTSTESSLSNYANAFGKSDGYEHTAPVRSFSPNALGIFDMSGNVWEWCWDWKDAYPSSSQTDPRGPGSGSYRVGRGGSWRSKPAYLRCAYRVRLHPDGRLNYTGFRLARAVR